MAVLAKVAAKSEAAVAELRGVLDEEYWLAEVYRQAAVLCCLQGRTVDEAARLLGCPRGTMATRLGRAKEQLRRRLTRRGWTVSTATLASVLADKALARVAAGRARGFDSCLCDWKNGERRRAVRKGICPLRRSVAYDVAQQDENGGRGGVGLGPGSPQLPCAWSLRHSRPLVLS